MSVTKVPNTSILERELSALHNYLHSNTTLDLRGQRLKYLPAILVSVNRQRDIYFDESETSGIGQKGNPLKILHGFRGGQGLVKPAPSRFSMVSSSTKSTHFSTMPGDQGMSQLLGEADLTGLRKKGHSSTVRDLRDLAPGVLVLLTKEHLAERALFDSILLNTPIIMTRPQARISFFEPEANYGITRQRSITGKIRAERISSQGGKGKEPEGVTEAFVTQLDEKRKRFDTLRSQYMQVCEDLRKFYDNERGDRLLTLSEESEVQFQGKTLPQLEALYHKTTYAMAHLQIEYINDNVLLIQKYVEGNDSLRLFRKNFEDALASAWDLALEENQATKGQGSALPRRFTLGGKGKEKATEQDIEVKQVSKQDEFLHRIFPEGQREKLISAWSHAVTLMKQDRLDPSLVGERMEPLSKESSRQEAEDLAQAMAWHFFHKETQGRLDKYLQLREGLEARASRFRTGMVSDPSHALAFLLEDYCLNFIQGTTREGQPKEARRSLSNLLKKEKGTEILWSPLAFVPHYFEITREFPSELPENKDAVIADLKDMLKLAEKAKLVAESKARDAESRVVEANFKAGGLAQNAFDANSEVGRLESVIDNLKDQNRDLRLQLEADDDTRLKRAAREAEELRAENLSLKQNQERIESELQGHEEEVRELKHRVTDTELQNQWLERQYRQAKQFADELQQAQLPRD